MERREYFFFIAGFMGVTSFYCFGNGFAPISCLAFVKGCPLGAFLKIPIQWQFVSRKTHTPCRSAVNNLQIVILLSKFVYHVDSIISASIKD